MPSRDSAMTSDHRELISFAHELADAAGEVILPYFRRRIDVIDKGAAKGRSFDPVTEADRRAEETIRKLIRARYPGDAIIGEEHGDEAGTSGRTWIIDPIDGTRAFITGQPLWGTLIALYEDDTPVIGMLDQPYMRERFVGFPGGAQLIAGDRMTPLKTRACATLSEAVVSTTHPWSYFDAAERANFERMARTARMSRFGGDCYGYALIACGFLDVIAESPLAVWDVAALIPIVQGAGGVITNWEGGSARLGGRILAAGDARVHAEAMRILNA